MGEELDRIHNRMRWEDNNSWKQCPKIVEKLLFSQSGNIGEAMSRAEEQRIGVEEIIV